MTRARASNPPAPRRISKYLSASSSAELARPAPTTSEASTSVQLPPGGSAAQARDRRPPPADPANRRSASRTREPPSLGTSTPPHVRQVVPMERPSLAHGSRPSGGRRRKPRRRPSPRSCGRTDGSAGAVAEPRPRRPFSPRATAGWGRPTRAASGSPDHGPRVLDPVPSSAPSDDGHRPSAAPNGHFGWTFGSPPGVPGGGMTGMVVVVPVSGGGFTMPGSAFETAAGGVITPLERLSWSLSEPAPGGWAGTSS